MFCLITSPCNAECLFPQENNKSPNRNKFVTPKSPLRKTKTRNISKSTLNSKANFNELNERNRSASVLEKEKESITTAQTETKPTESTPPTTQQALALQKQSAGNFFFTTRERKDWFPEFPVLPRVLTHINCRKPRCAVHTSMYCTVGHISRDLCFHKKYMEAGVMTFAANCTLCVSYKKIGC